MDQRSGINSFIKILYLFITGIWLFAQFSCEYEPSGIHFENLVKPEGEFPVAELSFKDSILVLSEATTFRYDVQFDLQEIYATEFYMDDRLMESDGDATGEVFVDPGPGHHTFEMFLYTSTGSGSIAETLGAEGFVYSQQWEIIMEDERYRSTDLQRVYVDDKGFMRIEWEPSQNFDFLSYEILRIDEDMETSLGIFTDRSATSCVDLSIIGGDAVYNLRLRTLHFDPVDGNPVSIQIPDYALYIIHEDSTSLNFSWSPCGVAGNFGGYQLTTGAGDLLYESDEILDTSVSFVLEPGTGYLFELEYLSNRPDPVLGTCSINREYFLGTNALPEYEVITQSMYPPYMVHTPAFSWDPITGTISYHDFPDHRGIFAVTPRNRYLLSGNKIYQGEDFTQLNKELHNIPPDVFNHQPPWVSLTIRFDRAFFDANYNRYLFSLSQDRVTDNYGNNRCWRGILSSDGYYLVSPNKKYNTLEFFSTFSNGSNSSYWLNQTGYTPNCNDDPVFINDREFVAVADPDIKRIQLGSGRVNASSLTSATNALCYDPISQTVLALSQESLMVYEIEDMILLFEMPIDVSRYSFERSHVAYMNKTVFLRGKDQGQSVMIPLSF